MFARFSRGLRCYSTSGGDSASFLTDLMKRIDNINARTQSISVKANAAKQTKPKSQGQAGAQEKSAKGAVRRNSQTKAAAPRLSTQKPQISIKVKDHPFSTNAFKLMDESNFKRPGQKPRAGANAGARNAGQAGSAPRANNRNNRARPTRDGAKKPLSNRRVASGQQSIVAKKLETKLLKPTVNGDVFFYGKPATGGITVASRVAAVAKGALLKSKYPYKLPKSIIDNMDAEFSGNRFLLQKDYTLEVDSAELADRMKKVVKGQAEDIVVGSKVSEAEKSTHRELLRCGTLATEQKQVIFDVVSGKTKVQDLLQNAAWNQ